MTVQTSLISGFNKFDNCSYLLSSNFRSAFVWVARFSITFHLSKTLYITHTQCNKKTVGLRFRKYWCMTIKRGKVSNGYDVMSIGKFCESFSYQIIIFSCLPLFCTCLPLFFIFKTILHAITWKACEFDIAESFYFRISLLSFLP